MRRAIEFDRPPRLPFWQSLFADLPDDVRDCWEMDRQKNGWFFDPNQWPTRRRTLDDWGCGWEASEVQNMGQVTSHPLEDWSALDRYRPPDPRDPFYFARLEKELADAGERYVAVTSHFTLFERLSMLHGFRNTLEDLYLEPDRCAQLLDRILEWKLEHWDELRRRFGDRVHGLFCTDDWGSQESTLISGGLFESFFLPRYRRLVDAAHANGWHFMLHSCGKVNAFVPFFIRLGIDVLNLGQPQVYGIRELGGRFAGRICFLATADIQKTLPGGNLEEVRAEVRELVDHWSTPDGGFIVFNYGNGGAIGVPDPVTHEMFREFRRRMRRP